MPMNTRLLLLASALCFACAPPARAQDFEREARWRDEVVPNLVVGEAVDLPGPHGRSFLGLFTSVPEAQTAIVIVHGIGVHPDHGIIGRLRMDLADRGFTTLAIQMPVLAADADAGAYLPLFADAARRIGAAADWLHEKGDRDLLLVSHSMGARMANAYFDGLAAGKPPFRTWISLGLSGGYTPAFAGRLPVATFDVYGESDLPAVLAAAEARGTTARATGGGQQRIAGANHFYAGREVELVDTVAGIARRR